MAPVKKSKPAAKAAKPKSSTPRKSTAPSIIKACEDSLKKLRALDLDQGLQNEIQWCLGSYGYDKNPAGLYEMVERSIQVFKEVKAERPKAVPATLLSSLEKALKSR